MKTITINDIRSLNPCYDPKRYLPENWKGTLVDILEVNECPLKDRLWAVTRFLDDKIDKLFAVYCAREALKLIDNPDQRAVNVVDVAEKYAHGEATKEELEEARLAAYRAVCDATIDAVHQDAYDAAYCAVYNTAYLAACAAIRAGVPEEKIVEKLQEMISNKETK